MSEEHALFVTKYVSQIWKHFDNSLELGYIEQCKRGLKLGGVNYRLSALGRLKAEELFEEGEGRKFSEALEHDRT
jgi:hypothetical protein